MTEEEKRTIDRFLEWVEICSREDSVFGNIKLNESIFHIQASIDHSALLQRLFSGKEALEYPPPLSFSYPWYDLVDNKQAGALEPQFYNSTIVSIHQTPWTIVEAHNNDEYIVESRGHVCRLSRLQEGKEKPKNCPGCNWVMELLEIKGKKI